MYICVIMYCTCPMQSQLETCQHLSYQRWTSCNWYALPQLTLARPLFYMVTFLVMVKLWEIFANIWVVGVRDIRWWWWWCWTRGSDAIATAPKCQIPEAEHKWQILQLLPCKTKDLEHKLERQHDGATRDMHRLQYLPLFLEPHTLWLTTMSGQGEGGAVGNASQSVRPTSHAKVDVESVEQYNSSHIHNVIHSDSHTRKLSFKFSVLFVNIFELFSFHFTLSNSRSMYSSKWPLRMPANDISRHYLAPD